MKFLTHYVIVLVSLLVLDGLWLGVITKSFYRSHLENLLRSEIIWPAVILFYLLYAAAIVYFVVVPAEGVWTKALISGALLGFTAYMTYDLVNYATLKDWSLSVVLLDLVWGSVITAVSAILATKLIK